MKWFHLLFNFIASTVVILYSVFRLYIDSTVRIFQQCTAAFWAETDRYSMYGFQQLKRFFDNFLLYSRQSNCQRLKISTFVFGISSFRSSPLCFLWNMLKHRKSISCLEIMQSGKFEKKRKVCFVGSRSDTTHQAGDHRSTPAPATYLLCQ